MRFTDKVVIVAGGTGGLGSAVSLAFLAEGSKVVVTYRKEDELQFLKRSAGKHEGNLTGRSVDAGREESVQTMIDSVLAEHRRIDVLVNTIGGYAGGVRLWELPSGAFEQMLTINLRTGYALLRAVAPVMLSQGHGAIVNVASRAAVDHAAGAAPYAASKSAALAMVDSLAADLKGTGVRVNTVLPSIIDTEANRKAMPGADFRKWPKPEDIARVILFLCSDDAKVIHGAAIPVYGDS